MHWHIVYLNHPFQKGWICKWISFFFFFKLPIISEVPVAFVVGSVHACLCSPDVGIGSRLLAGCTTGAMAVAVAQPTDVVKVRFQAQPSTTGASRRYHSTMHAYRTIAREEGIRGLWKGTCLGGRHLY